MFESKMLFGLTAAAFGAAFLGCAKPPPASDTATPEAISTGEGHLHSAAPHGGTIADWGLGEYHVEFTVDHDKEEATVYVLGSDAKSPAPIPTDKLQLNINEPAMQLDLLAKSLEGEANGKSSRFVGQHHHLGNVREFDGSIVGVVDGKPYVGEFRERAHDHAH